MDILIILLSVQSLVPSATSGLNVDFWIKRRKILKINKYKKEKDWISF